MYAFGKHANGELGLGTFNNSINIPTLNPYLNGNDIQKISISNHSLILLSKELNLNFLF